MILQLKKSTPEETINRLKKDHFARIVTKQDHIQAVTTKSTECVPEYVENYLIKSWHFDTDIQLASKSFEEKRVTSIGTVEIGNPNTMNFIAGPCSVESEDQIFTVAHSLAKLGIKSLRAGCYKPRTSPYSFMGMGKDGLKLLDQVRKETNLNIVTEVRDATHVDDVLDVADVVQIGAKSMYDHGILNACGATDKTVLIKRGFGTTLKEFIQAAEFVLSAGNSNVILCERGIRTFETETRFTLDLCGVAFLKENCNLPIVVDPSHALGFRYGISDLSKAATAMGVDGLLIEAHPEPDKALSDSAQQIDLQQLSKLHAEINQLGLAVNLKLI